jgi:hypothetical protein
MLVTSFRCCFHKKLKQTLNLGGHLNLQKLSKIEPLNELVVNETSKKLYSLEIICVD